MRMEEWPGGRSSSRVEGAAAGVFAVPLEDAGEGPPTLLPPPPCSRDNCAGVTLRALLLPTPARLDKLEEDAEVPPPGGPFGVGCDASEPVGDGLRAKNAERKAFMGAQYIAALT